MNSEFNSNTRFYFVIDGVKTYFKNAPIGWNETEQNIKRATETDGLMLDVLQNLQFVKAEKDIIIKEHQAKGNKANIQVVKEVKYGNEFLIESSGYLDPLTIQYDYKTATADFYENEFDKKIRDNFSTDFEIDRLTDLDGNDLEPLVTETYVHTPTRLRLRSKLVSDGFSNIASNQFAQDGYYVPTMQTEYQSNVEVQFVLDRFILNTNNIESSNCFFYQAERDKTLRILVNFSIEISPFNFAAYRFLRVDASNTFIESIPLQSFNSTTQNSTLNINDTYSIDLLEGESLVFGLFVDSGIWGVNVAEETNTIEVLEDSYYYPEDAENLNIECVTLYDAFKRAVSIIDRNLFFESDLITTHYPNLPLFSGETARHMQREGEKVPLFTTSLQQLFELINTITPCTFFLERIGKKNTFRVEDVGYVFDSFSRIDLGTINKREISFEVNPSKVYSGVKIGFQSKTDEDEIYGYQSTHSTNEYNLPSSNGNVYEATSNVIVDPVEIELTFRKQFAEFPDEETQRDKDLFAVHSNSVNGKYFARVWQDDFSEVSGVENADTSYNFLLTPVNCLFRHAKNFMQEYVKPVYNNDKITYLSTTGNASFSTTLIGGTQRLENGTFNLSIFDKPLYNDLLIKIKTQKRINIVNQINGISGNKKNYYTAVTYKDNDGNRFSGFITDVKIKNDIQLELYGGV